MGVGRLQPQLLSSAVTAVGVSAETSGGWVGGDGVQVISRTSHYQLDAAPSHAQVSARVVKWILGKRLPASLHLGLLLIGHVLFM